MMTKEEKMACARVAMIATYQGKVCEKLDKWLETRADRDFEDLVAQHNHSKEVVERLHKQGNEARKAERESQAN